MIAVVLVLSILACMLALADEARLDRKEVRARSAELAEKKRLDQGAPAWEHEALAPRSVEKWDHPETCEQCHPRLEQVVAYLNNGHTAGSVLESGSRQVDESLAEFGRRVAKPGVARVRPPRYETPITDALASEMRALRAELEQDKERFDRDRERGLTESLAALVRTHGQGGHIMEFGQNKPIRPFRQAL